MNFLVPIDFKKSVILEKKPQKQRLTYYTKTFHVALQHILIQGRETFCCIFVWYHTCDMHYNALQIHKKLFSLQIKSL